MLNRDEHSRALRVFVSNRRSHEYSQMGLWRGDEYFKKRYEYAAEYLDLLQKLWREERVTHHSDFFDFEDCPLSTTQESQALA